MSQPTSPPNRLELAERLLQAWFERRTDGVAADLESLVRAHPELEAELRDLHAACGALNDVFDLGRQGHATEQSRVAAILEQIGADVDPNARYALEGEIAKGGMGVVYRVRDTKLDRPLAMKVILGQADVARTGKTPPIPARQLARFVNEAKITGQLDHPGIVPVHEVGVDAQGRAFFTMKLVKGMTLAEVFARRAAADPDWSRPRVLGVIQRVCEAMAFAHERRVIHRDLKPQNVMVGDFGEVYVMDWGLARRIDEAAGASVDAETTVPAEVDEELRQQVSLTRDGAIVGTPPYMSPEQARGEIGSMGPASDVYAIGAMLYQLIAGRAPYAKHGESATGSQILARVVSGPPDRLASSASAPELISICERAMAREPTSRYRDVVEIGADLRAFLEGRVVRAHRTGAATELWKWIQRNRSFAVSIAAGIAVLMGGMVVSLVLRARAQDSEQRALRSAQHAAESELLAQREAVRAGQALQREAAERRRVEERDRELQLAVSFQSEMLSELDPARMASTLIEDLRAAGRHELSRAGANADPLAAFDREFERWISPVVATEACSALIDTHLLKRSELAIDERFAGEPVVKTALETTLSSVYAALGRIDDAERLARASTAARLAFLGEDDSRTIDSIGGLGALFARQGRYHDSEECHRIAAEWRERQFGSSDPLTLTSKNNLVAALIELARYDEAEVLCGEVAELRAQTLGELHPDMITTRNLQGLLASRRGKLADAEAAYRRALDASLASPTAGADMTITLLANLAGNLIQSRRASEARPFLDEAIERAEQFRGRKHPLALTMYVQRTSLDAQAGRFEDVLRSGEDLLPELERVLGPDHGHTLNVLGNMGLALKRLGRLDEASLCYERVLAAIERSVGEGHPQPLTIRINMSMLMLAQKRFADAASFCGATWETADRALGVENRLALEAGYTLGHILRESGRIDEAATVLREVLARQESALGSDDADTISSVEDLAGALRDAGRFTEAEPLLRRALARHRARGGAEDGDAVRMELRLAELFIDLDRLDEAEQSLLECERRFAERASVNPKTLAWMYERLGRLYGARDAREPGAGHAERAQAYRDKALGVAR